MPQKILRGEELDKVMNALFIADEKIRKREDNELLLEICKSVKGEEDKTYS